jgi:hypothetical protein
LNALCERRTKATLRRDRRELAALPAAEVAERSTALGVNPDCPWLSNPIDDLFFDPCDGMPPELLHFDERVSCGRACVRVCLIVFRAPVAPYHIFNRSAPMFVRSQHAFAQNVKGKMIFTTFFNCLNR